MADLFPTEISIGGKISRALLPSLIEKIEDEGFTLKVSDDAPEVIVCEDDCRENTEFFNGDEQTLEFFDNEVASGEFDRLEEFLRIHNLQYDVRFGSRFGDPAGIRRWRPGMNEPALSDATEQGEQVVPASEIYRLVDEWKQTITKGEFDASEDVESFSLGIINSFNALCDVENIPPVDKFEIVGG